MAQSPAHRFGQIIGDLLEAALRPLLEQIADEHGLYLDYKHPRLARGGKRKVAWRDYRGNEHDLDYVLEQGGSEATVGRPKAFIEIAWRRYTKHSRNKAQEIQGAIMPLAETYRDSRPFLGVVLAGVFTEGSITQLRSHGFQVVYFSYESVVAAFKRLGIDARFDESTSDAALQHRVRALEAMNGPAKARLARTLRGVHKESLDEFLGTLCRALRRALKTIRIIPLHGSATDVRSVGEAVAFLEAYDESGSVAQFVKFEIQVRYTNGDEIRGEFQSKREALAFLKTTVESGSRDVHL